MKKMRKSNVRRDQRFYEVDNDENQEENCDLDSLDGSSSITSKNIPIKTKNERSFEKISLPFPRKLYSEHFLLEQTIDESSFHENLLKIKTMSNDFGNAIQTKREVWKVCLFLTPVPFFSFFPLTFQRP
jgi:hypothetical protein